MFDEKNQKKNHRKTARVIWHDYNGGAYFITICTKNREHFFGKTINVPVVGTLRATSLSENDNQIHNKTLHTTSLQTTMQLTPVGQFLYDNLQNITTHYPYAEIPLFVVMPNHIHLIVFIECRDVACNVRMNANDVQDVARNVPTTMAEIAKRQSLLCVAMRGIKSAVTKFAHENDIDFAWQPRFHDHIIRNTEEMNRIADYIENNPARWENDCYNENNQQNKK